MMKEEPDGAINYIICHNMIKSKLLILEGLLMTMIIILQSLIHDSIELQKSF